MKDDFSALQEMKYSGRGITIGMTDERNPFIAYSLSGRSPSSQARKLVLGEKTGIVRTDVTDKQQLEKGSPALLLYPALIPAQGVEDVILASNGAQTNLLYSHFQKHFSHPAAKSHQPQIFLSRALESGQFQYDAHEDRMIDLGNYEPDAPNNTPRISGVVTKTEGALHIIRASPDSTSYGYELEPGKGKLITTYSGGNENPLQPFSSEPHDVYIGSLTPQDLCESVYAALRGKDESVNYRVAAAVMMYKDNNFITAIINRSERGD